MKLFNVRKKHYSLINQNDLNQDNKTQKLYSWFNIKYIFLTLIVLELFFIIYFYLRLKIIDDNIIINLKENVTTNRLNNSSNISHISREEALKLGKEYLDICEKGILINNKILEEYKNPIFSIIIPVYNSENYIRRAIRSIQNQNMLNLEIILVNDLPSDNTTKIIEEMKKEDPRIKIIYNQKNMGVLYSRSIGAIEARGKYITTIDNDDLFINKDIFNIIYNETENDYFLTILNNNIPNKIFQPELGIFPVEKKNTIFPNNILLWGKAIKNEVYKSALNLIGKERFSNLIIWAEDTSVFFVISNIADSYKYIKDYGIIHFDFKKSASTVLSIDEKRTGNLFLLNIIFDFSKNEYKKNGALFLIQFVDEFKSLTDDKLKLNLKYLINKIVNCDYIEESIKNEVKIKFKNFL